MLQPTGTLPVNETIGSRGSVTRAGAALFGTGRIDHEPAGRSVSASSSPSSSAVSGVAGAGFRTIGAPTAIAGAILCATRLSGKLNGLMLSTGPRGTRRIIAVRPMPAASSYGPRTSTVSALADLTRANDEARRVLAHGAGVTRFDDLPAVDLLSLVPAETADRFSASVLRHLRSTAAGAELSRSLTAWLAHHGQWDAAAAELGVHRHTLRNRMRKVEGLLGRDLNSADLRAELWLALRIQDSR